LAVFLGIVPLAFSFAVILRFLAQLGIVLSPHSRMAQILKPPMGIAILAMIDPKRRRDERRAARPGLRWLLTLSIFIPALHWHSLGDGPIF